MTPEGPDGIEQARSDDSVRCIRCGAPLVAETTEAGVRPIGGERLIPFRRKTDHVLCLNCLASYGARTLLPGEDAGGHREQPVPSSDPGDEVDDLERLESLAEGREPAS